MPSETASVVNQAGVARFERRWAVAEPRAALLLVHGISEHSGRYEHVGDALAAHGIDVAAFDLRGHGQTEGRKGYIDSFDDFLDDVEDLLGERRTLGVPVVLMGHSLGGLISVTYAESDRPAADLLVLSAPALGADVPGWQRVAAAALGRVVPKLAVPNTFNGELLTRDESVTIAYQADPLRIPSVSARLGNEVFTTMVTATANLGRVTIPTYVLHGTADRLVPPSASAGFETMPNATRVLLDGLRHECLNEPERDDVIAGITTWLDHQLTLLAHDHP